MSGLGLFLVIICGGIIAVLVICGTAEEVCGGIGPLELAFATGMWVIGLSIVGGLIYGIQLLAHGSS